MKAVVSGIKGNLGKHIKTHFAGEVVGLERNDWGKDFSGADCFIHCAYDLKNTYLENPGKVLDSNISSVGHSLELCRKQGIKKYVFISSCSVYGDSSKTYEDIVLSPTTVNGFCKMIGERVVADFCKQHDMEFLILRPFNSYGGEDHFSVVSKMIKAAKKNMPFTLCNGGRAERDFIHIDDLAQVVCKLAIDDSVQNEILNIGTGKSTKVIDILKKVEKEYGKVELQEKTDVNETVYSRASIRRLRKILDFDFKDILDVNL